MGRAASSQQNADEMDELAAVAGQDPLAYRLKYLKPKWAAVLKAQLQFCS